MACSPGMFQPIENQGHNNGHEPGETLEILLSLGSCEIELCSVAAYGMVKIWVAFVGLQLLFRNMTVTNDNYILHNLNILCVLKACMQMLVFTHTHANMHTCM